MKTTEIIFIILLSIISIILIIEILQKQFAKQNIIEKSIPKNIITLPRQLNFDNLVK